MASKTAIALKDSLASIKVLLQLCRSPPTRQGYFTAVSRLSKPNPRAFDAILTFRTMLYSMKLNAPAIIVVKRYYQPFA